MQQITNIGEVFTEPFHVFALYAAINGLVMLVLAVLVSRARQKTGTNIGDGGKPEMARPLRAHANNTEYTPMALILLWATLPSTGTRPGLTGHRGSSGFAPRRRSILRR